MAKYVAKKIPHFNWEKETLGGTQYQGGFYKSGQDKGLPFRLDLSMSKIKPMFKDMSKFKGHQSEVSKHLTMSVHKMVTSINYDYTPLKDYTPKPYTDRWGHEKMHYVEPAYRNNHRHLYEDVGISHGETASPVIKMWGLVYRATNPITGFNYAAKQYYGPDYDGSTDFANRDRSIHKKAQVKWLDPLMTPGNEYHDKFVSSNEQYLKTMYTKIVKDALGVKK